jgi:hypothetical protein
VAGNEDDRKMNFRSGEVALEIESASPRQSDVKHNASGRVRALAIQKFLRGPEQLHAKCHRAKKTVERIPDGRIVVNDKYDRLVFTHETSPNRYGKCGGNRSQTPMRRMGG